MILYWEALQRKSQVSSFVGALRLFYSHPSASQAGFGLKIKKPGLLSVDLAFSL
jgi:hypothetical protein